MRSERGKYNYAHMTPISAEVLNENVDLINNAMAYVDFDIANSISSLDMD